MRGEKDTCKVLSHDCCINEVLPSHPHLVTAARGEGPVYRVEGHRVHGENLVPLAVALEGVLVILGLLVSRGRPQARG